MFPLNVIHICVVDRKMPKGNMPEIKGVTTYAMISCLLKHETWMILVKVSEVQNAVKLDSNRRPTLLDVELKFPR